MVTLVPVSLPSKLKPSRSLQNYILIWLDLHINESDEYYQSSISQLRSIIFSVNTFTDTDRCIDFLTDISEEKVFMILSSSFAQQLVPILRDLSEIDSIYVFCDSQFEHEIWPEQWVKLKGVFSDIDQICSTLKRDTRRFDYSMTAISIMRTTDSLDRNLDELDQSFMYSQLLTDILLDMNYVLSGLKLEINDRNRKQYSRPKKRFQVYFEENATQKSKI